MKEQTGNEQLIDRILEIELRMFVAVPTDKPYSCQDDEENFRLHRRSQFAVWSERTLESYLDDLTEAGLSGTNLMTLKYARMDNLIPPLKTNPIIEKIAAVQLKWQEEMYEEYPNFMKGARPLSGAQDSEGNTSFDKDG